MEATELEKLIHKCINLQNIIEKGTKTTTTTDTTNRHHHRHHHHHTENTTIEALEKEYTRWSSKFPEHASDFDAYVNNSIRRRTSITTDAKNHHLLAKSDASNSMRRASVDNKIDTSTVKGIKINTERDDDDADEYTKVINQIFPYQEGIATTTNNNNNNYYYYARPT